MNIARKRCIRHKQIHMSCNVWNFKTDAHVPCYNTHLSTYTIYYSFIFLFLVRIVRLKTGGTHRRPTQRKYIYCSSRVLFSDIDIDEFAFSKPVCFFYTHLCGKYLKSNACSSYSFKNKSKNSLGAYSYIMLGVIIYYTYIFRALFNEIISVDAALVQVLDTQRAVRSYMSMYLG